MITATSGVRMIEMFSEPSYSSYPGWMCQIAPRPRPSADILVGNSTLASPEDLPASTENQHSSSEKVNFRVFPQIPHLEL